MSEVKHTPGPWKAVPTAFGPIDIALPDGRDIVTVYGGGTGNKEANARLIAAAPEMLEALRDVATFARVFRGRMENVPGDEALEALGETVAAAIDKAEGRS